MRPCLRCSRINRTSTWVTPWASYDVKAPHRSDSRRTSTPWSRTPVSTRLQECPSSTPLQLPRQLPRQHRNMNDACRNSSRSKTTCCSRPLNSLRLCRALSRLAVKDFPALRCHRRKRLLRSRASRDRPIRLPTAALIRAPTMAVPYDLNRPTSSRSTSVKLIARPPPVATF